MISDDVKERIDSGEIKIENGRLIGLGALNNSIDITALDKLFDGIGNEGVISTISDTMSAIAQVLADCSFAEEYDSDSKELKRIITEDIQQTIRTVDFFKLNMIMKTFIK